MPRGGKGICRRRGEAYTERRRQGGAEDGGRRRRGIWQKKTRLGEDWAVIHTRRQVVRRRACHGGDRGLRGVDVHPMRR